MNELGQLAVEADTAATFRGHKLGFFTSLSDTKASADCAVCGMGVSVNTSPPPNGIDIGGEAVALNCKDPS